MSIAMNKIARQRGIPIVDATEDMVLEVRPADIKKGAAKTPEGCAFARACKRQNKGQVVGAHFYRTTAWVELPDKIVRYRLPPSMTQEIVAFDRGGPMEPGLYKLKAPAGTTKLGSNRNKKPADRHSSPGTNPPKHFVHATGNVRRSAK